MDDIREKLAAIKENMSEDAKIQLLEDKLNEYREKSHSFLKNKHFITGNKRIVDAFPTMKFIPKNKPSISVKEMIGYINTKVKKIIKTDSQSSLYIKSCKIKIAWNPFKKAGIYYEDH